MVNRRPPRGDFRPQPKLALDPEVLRNWRQPKRMTVSQWADENRVLEPLFASEPGPWQTDRCPYAREWMDSANLPWVHDVALMCSTQVGKSEAMSNVAGFYIHQKPSPTMFVLPNRDAARLAGERRIIPMVMSSPALSDELTDRAHDVKNKEIVFKRSVIYMRSAGSATDLASVPVRLVLCDEVDKFPQWTGKEASPVALVRERTRTYHDYVMMVASTPTTREGLIHSEHAKGDQRKFNVPCPHCEEWQPFEWSRITWDKSSVTTGNDMRKLRCAWYVCRKCFERIDDVHKRDMLLAGVWLPEGVVMADWLGGLQDADRNEHRSYHIWAAYSPWVTFWKIVAAFLDAKDEPALLMNFTNSWLAEVWEERVGTTSEEAIEACIDPDRKQYDVPKQVLVITAAVDVQVDYVVWQVMGWGLDEEGWVIAQGRCEDFDQLEAEVMRPWGTEQLMPRICVVDSRYRRDEVMDFCRRNKTIARMIAGVERNTPVPFSTVKIDKHPKTGRVLPHSMTVWTINVGMFKDLVAHRLRLAIDPPETPVGLLHLPCDLEPHWLNQMSAEHKVAERSGGKVKRRWVLKPGRKRNETWDVTVYNAAAAKMIRADTLRSDKRGGAGYVKTNTPPKAKGKRPPPMGSGKGRGINPGGGRW